MIAAEVAHAEPKPRSRVLLIAAVIWLALAIGGYAFWRSQQPGQEAFTAQAAMAVPPAEPPQTDLPGTAGTDDDPDTAETGATEGDGSAMANGVAVVSHGDGTADPIAVAPTTTLAEADGSGTTNLEATGRMRGASTTNAPAAAPLQTAHNQAGSAPSSSAAALSEPRESATRESSTRESSSRDSQPRESSGAPIPATPKIAIIARGERSLGAAIQEHLERTLSGPGLELVDIENDADLSDLMFASGGNVTIGEVAPRLSASGVGVVVVVQVDPLGERMLSYMGRQEPALSSRAKVNVFNVADRKAMGPGWSTTLEYTKIAADKKAEAFADDKGSEIAAAIRDGWAEFRRR